MVTRVWCSCSGHTDTLLETSASLPGSHSSLSLTELRTQTQTYTHTYTHTHTQPSSLSFKNHSFPARSHCFYSILFPLAKSRMLCPDLHKLILNPVTYGWGGETTGTQHPFHSWGRSPASDSSYIPPVSITWL